MTGMIELKHIEDLRGKNAILLFGKIRAGKSTFINDAYGERVAKTTNSIKSDTNEISYVNRPIRVDKHEVVLVDTVGFGALRDGDRFSFTCKWLSILYPGQDSRKSTLQATVKGILYFINIMDGALNEDNMRNLETFKALVGKELLKSVIFVTSKWAKKEEEEMRGRHEDNYEGWEEKIREDFPGASILRLDDTTGRLSETRLAKLSPEERKKKEGEYRNNAMRVLQQLLKKPATQPLLAQREMHEGGKRMKVGETTLGKTTIEHLSQDFDGLTGRKAEANILHLQNTRLGKLDSGNTEVKNGKNRWKDFFARIIHNDLPIMDLQRDMRTHNITN